MSAQMTGCSNLSDWAKMIVRLSADCDAWQRLRRSKNATI